VRRPLPVLTQGDDYVVVAKPPLLLVHRTGACQERDAALQRVRDQMRRHVFPIHRLDRSASGCLLFGTEPRGVEALQHALTHGRKTYIAFVRGTFTAEGPVVVDTPMTDTQGTLKEARSVVRCIGRSLEPRCSLLVVEPETGRFHQVRRHVRDLHHPVLGDTKHGDSRVNRQWRETWGLHRVALHALSLHLEHASGPIEATCPLFEDMAFILRQMPWWDEAVAAVPALGLTPLPVRAKQEADESPDTTHGDLS
jgi:tRNA pseudouridine65 synthase